jgi:hypothetical protein
MAGGFEWPASSCAGMEPSMKALFASIVVASLAAGNGALAKERPTPQGGKLLRQALSSVAVSADPQGPKSQDHFNPKTGSGQGAIHANPGAILRVCSKDTPAAHRAAICQVGISPE